jgi:uncharacterized protein (UPF0332 family)
LPTKGQHLAKAEHNQKLADTLVKGSYPDWAVTIYFYSALHYVHAVLAVYGQHPESHEATAPLVRRNPVLKKVWAEYRSLQTAARNARYYAAVITNDHLQDVCNDYNTLKSYLRQQLGIKE